MNNIYVGDKVTYEDNASDNVYYTYDTSAHLVSMNLNGVEYYYIRNAQGDIIGLFDKSGTLVVSYIYDTWGKLIAIGGSLKDSVGVKNPYRYRGYRYDTETGLYYLQSRYYNPEWGRFINADGVAGQVGELLSHNVFAYCANNAISREDSDGFSWREATESGCDTGGTTYSSSESGVSSWRSYPKGAGNAERQLLSGSEWNEYFKQTYGSENVEWVTKNKASFGSRNLLEGHFDKHGSEFGGIYSNADEYLQGAKDVMNNGYKVQYDYKVTDKWGMKVPEQRTGYMRFMGNNRKGEAKFEFVGTNNRGDITTYHTESGKTLWKLLNGSNTDKTINPIK